MSSLERAQRLIDLGYYVAPAHEYALLTPDVDPRKTPYATEEAARGSHINVYHGTQRDGYKLNLIDLDSHHADQDADAARAAFEQALPHIARKVSWHRSRHGKGWHGYVKTTKALPHGRLYADGRHIGEILSSDSSRSIPPIDLGALPVLTLTEREHVLAFWSVQSSGSSGDRWADRAREGRKWVAFRKRRHVTLAQLRAFLTSQCGRVGQQLDALFDESERFNRSDAAGNVIQTLMLFAHKLPCGWNADFYEKCGMVYDYWLAADSYGKAGEKGYDQEKDGQSLIAQIVHEDTRLSGQKWTCPFWAKSGATGKTSTMVEIPEPPKRPAHRPAGDQERQLARFKRLLERRWEDDPTGTFYYFADDLDDWAAACGVRRRTVQGYLTILETAGQITRGQQSGRAGGRPWMTILPAFWDASNSPKACKTDAPEAPSEAETASDRNASPIAVQPIQTPETDVSTPQCIKEKDHQKACAPIPSAPQPVDEWAWADAWLSSPAGQRTLAKCRGRTTVDPATFARFDAIARGGPPVGAQSFGAPPLAPAGARDELADVARLFDAGDFDAAYIAVGYVKSAPLRREWYARIKAAGGI